MDCPLRYDMRFGSTEQSGPPPLRTHDAAVAEGVKCDAYAGPAVHHPRLESGINGSSPFAFLARAMFNIIRDLNPDMMHVIVNFFLHWLPVLSGLRRPTHSSKLKKPTAPCSDADMQKYNDELTRLTKAQAACDLMALTQADRERVDTRMNDLSLCAKYVKKSHIPFATTDGGKKPKAADWCSRSHNAHIMFTSCSHNAHIMCTSCSHNAHIM